MIPRTRLIAVVMFSVILLAGCGEDGRYGMTFINQGEHVIGTEQQVIGDLAIAGGTVTIEEGASLVGSVYLLGGALVVAGNIDGDVVALGGDVTLDDTAVVGRDFYVAGSEVTRSDDAIVTGAETALSGEELGIGQERSIGRFLWQLATTTIFVSILAGVTVRLMPTLTRRLSATSTGYPLMSGALGLLLLLVLPILLLFMALTIVLLPVTLIGGLILVVLVTYGVIGLGRGLGEWVAWWRGWTTGPVRAGMIGTASIAILLNLVGLIPIVAEISLVLVTAVAIGSVVLSGFGTRLYEPPEYVAEPERAYTSPE